MRYVSKIQIIIFAAAVVAAALVAGCANAPPPPAKTSAPEVIVAKAEPAPAPCNDIDLDGVCDADDRCRMLIGPAETFGCPIDPCNGSPLLVLVQFKYDSSEMPARKAGAQTMAPVLDAVAEAIAKDSSCRVCIVGHTSEEGTPDHNEELSRRRASAVQDYMVNHDLSQLRMPTTGMGERCQLVPEKSRELNRRVEFRRLKQGEPCPTDCSI